jgi:hypothetical protein
MKRISALLAMSSVCSLMLLGCDNPKQSTQGNPAIKTVTAHAVEVPKPNPGQKVGKVLPFSVCDLQNNTAFENGFSQMRADIKVTGGHSNDWVATGIAVAKQLGALGASTDVQVYVYRNDLGELDTNETPNGYKWLTRVDYGVTPQHSLNTSDGGKPWLISYATDESVVSSRNILIERDFQALLEKYGNPSIDDKVVAMIKKKYGIKGEWRIPTSNMDKHTDNPAEYFIDSQDQAEKLNELHKLLSHNSRNLECTV